MALWMRGWIVAGLLLLAGGQALAQEPALPTLSMMETVEGTLGGGRSEARWRYEGAAGEQISLVVRPLDDGLDPVLEVFDATGRLLAAADDIAYPERLAAALEGLELPRDETYTIRVGGYEGATAGVFRLTLLPAFAAPIFEETFDGARDWQAGSGGLVEANLFEGQLLLEIDTPSALGWAAPEDPPEVPLTAYVQVDVVVANDPDYWEAGIILRQVSPTSYYLFSISGRGDWAFLARSGGSTWMHIQDWTTHPALDNLNKAARLGVLMEDDTFTFYVNGEQLGSVTAGVIEEPGQIALGTGTIDRQETYPFVAFDNLLITGPIPNGEDNGAARPIENYLAADSGTIVGELVEQGLIPEGGEQVMLVRSSFTTITRAGINTLGLGQGRTQADFVLSTAVTLAAGGEENACGVFFRQEDEEQYGLAFLDARGGVGMTYRQGETFDPAVYVDDQFEALEGVRLLLVGQGDEMRVYVNGSLVARQTHPEIEGSLGIAALSYDGQFTDCQFGDTWLWTWN
ncbi:MAG: hypothetical protein JXN59_02920 [Anaerolineae bacterium]|nr:hypothetical protein [Anaerolineae bacterium]